MAERLRGEPARQRQPRQTLADRLAGHEASRRLRWLMPQYAERRCFVFAAMSAFYSFRRQLPPDTPGIAAIAIENTPIAAEADIAIEEEDILARKLKRQSDAFVMPCHFQHERRFATLNSCRLFSAMMKMDIDEDRRLKNSQKLSMRHFQPASRHDGAAPRRHAPAASFADYTLYYAIIEYFQPNSWLSSMMI